MAPKYKSEIGITGVTVTAESQTFLSRKRIPCSEWPALPGMLSRSAQLLFALVEQGDAEGRSDSVFLNHSIVVQLPSSVCDTLAIPPLATLSATLSFDGRVDSPEGRVRIRWYDPNLRVVSATRLGAFLNMGKEPQRLNRSLFDLLVAIEAFNNSSGSAPDVRLQLWDPVQRLLHDTTGIEIKDEYLKSLNIYQAGSFALDVRHGVNGPDFVPVLMSRSKAKSLEDDANTPDFSTSDSTEPFLDLRDESLDSLLPPDLHRQFADRHFGSSSSTRSGYVIGRNTFLLIDSELKVALDVVRHMRRRSLEERKAFIRNPRPALASALGGEDSDIVSASLFVETKQYSERVEGLAIWDPPKLPWLRKKAGQWLPETFVVKIGKEAVQLTPEAFEDLAGRSEQAKAEGLPTVEFAGKQYPVDDVEKAVSSVRETWPDEELPTRGDETSAETALDVEDRHVLKVKANVEGVEFVLVHTPRPNLIGYEIPRHSLSSTSPKAHQLVGIKWLLEAWSSGWPGVLLADDMGLGKTFQALLFLAWIKSNQAYRDGATHAPLGPVLVVAPTALLGTWAKEAALHLRPDTLGERIDAYGSGLRRLKGQRLEGSTPDDALDVEALRKAGWILTTYETLADNHRAFARVGFSIAVFDEMQKIKSPGTINTHAAKAMNADFVLGLTGTPIENRLEDLWCILDRIAPGYLGDLKSFSAEHAEENPEALKTLKARLDQPQQNAPAIMLRRMKEEILEGLPARLIRSYRASMPALQADAYSRTVQEAKNGSRSMESMLKAIHALRGISLHPQGGDGLDGYDLQSVENWIGQSARVSQAMTILSEIKQHDEKALIYVEDRSVQKALAQVLATFFKLRAEPTIINGETPGPKRQAIVENFQLAPPGFGLLILSPKAAGLGLTITAANHVIHLSRWWNPAVEDQCNDRVYRIGQDKPVTVHVPMAMHPDFGESSFDVTLDELLTRKRALSRHMLAPPVSDNDVDALFSSSIAAHSN